MVSSALTIQDILPFRANNKKVDMDAFLPFIVLPFLLLIATISRTITIIIMVVIGMGVLYVYTRPRQKNRSPFFFSWTMSSAVTMFLVFEIIILGLLEVTQLENFIFLLLLACTCYFFYKMKAIADFELATGSSKGKEYSPVLTSDSYYCQVCQIEVNERFFHSIWWDCCVLRPNYVYFLAGQICAFATLLFGTNLGLTTVCQPFIFYGLILLPEDCNDAYYEFDLSLGFVTCVYGVGYLFVIALVLIRQLLIYLPKYSEPQWRKLVNVLNV
ncbi:palmitoyltransferase ZDHHC23 [Bombyx mandarina]|uniref:Palmitoyltransferase n=3 Tax=Bombyx TaxID=7090 RepID=A0A8R1WLT8_BOMMO|nr:palmitoyltransferase ZDHHC23 isoform X1 [Bombyx mori]XP_028037762.1 palmitoyltransferase ZDHHC23 [Bombyx mandarina]